MLPAPASRLQFTVVLDIAADVPAVFDAIVSETGMKAWAPGCRHAEWRHPPGATALGVGSVRRLTLGGNAVAEERIVAWEEGRELHYSFDAPMQPISGLTRGYVGVNRVDAIGAGRTRLTWAAHYDTPGWLALTAPAMRASLRLLIAAMARRVARTAEAH